MLPTHELLVEGFTNRDEVVRAVDESSETGRLKTALLGVVFLDRQFAMQFDDEPEAMKLADRLRSLGFQCKVWNGPDPTQRVGYEAEQDAAPDRGGE